MAVSRASLCGRRRESGVTIGPVMILVVAIAIAAIAIHGSSTALVGGL